MKILRIAATVILSAIVILCIIFRNRFTVHGIVKLTPDSIPLAILTLYALFALKSVSVVLYFGLLYAASGILFPLPLAILVNLGGTVIMCSLPFFIGRWLGTDLVTYLVGRYSKIRELHERKQGNDFKFCLLVRIIRVLPCDPLAFYMGASGVRYVPYLLTSLLGFMSSCVTFPLMGEKITEPGSRQFIIAMCIELCVIAGSFGTYLILTRRHRKKLAAQKESTNVE